MTPAGGERPHPSPGPLAEAPRWRRWAPLLALVALMGLIFAMGWHRLLSLETIGLNYDRLRAFIADNSVAAVLIYVATYIGIVALSLPGAAIMTLAGGLLFGWQVGAPAAIVAATIGATLLFLIAKTSFGEALAAKAGLWLAKLAAGFNENAFSYLLFLRLTPVFPFFVVNLAPALLGVPLATFVAATAIGIIPATFVYSFAGSSLGGVVEAQNAMHNACLAKAGATAQAQCPYTIDVGALVTKEILLTFAFLGLLALLPVAIKSWSKRRAA